MLVSANSMEVHLRTKIGNVAGHRRAATPGPISGSSEDRPSHDKQLCAIHVSPTRDTRNYWSKNIQIGLQYKSAIRAPPSRPVVVGPELTIYDHEHDAQPCSLEKATALLRRNACLKQYSLAHTYSQSQVICRTVWREVHREFETICTSR